MPRTKRPPRTTRMQATVTPTPKPGHHPVPQAAETRANTLATAEAPTISRRPATIGWTDVKRYHRQAAGTGRGGMNLTLAVHSSTAQKAGSSRSEAALLCTPSAVGSEAAVLASAGDAQADLSAVVLPGGINLRNGWSART